MVVYKLLGTYLYIEKTGNPKDENKINVTDLVACILWSRPILVQNLPPHQIVEYKMTGSGT